MNGSSYLLDTNILVYALKGIESVMPYFEEDCYLSVITEIEILGVPGLNKNSWVSVNQQLIFVPSSLLPIR
jgi:predicted nucleic acid-binding protein